MKNFLYCENQEGGMCDYEITEHEIYAGKPDIPYWMDNTCKEEDQRLLKWAKRAEIGEYRNHRLGVLIRLKDKD